MQVQWNAKIRTFGFQTGPKTERSIVQTSRVRLSNVQFVRTFGFWTATSLDHFIFKKIICMTPFIKKRPSLVVCLKTERSNVQSFGFRTQIIVR